MRGRGNTAGTLPFILLIKFGGFTSVRGLQVISRHLFQSSVWFMLLFGASSGFLMLLHLYLSPTEIKCLLMLYFFYKLCEFNFYCPLLRKTTSSIDGDIVIVQSLVWFYRWLTANLYRDKKKNNISLFLSANMDTSRLALWLVGQASEQTSAWEKRSCECHFTG